MKDITTAIFGYNSLSYELIAQLVKKKIKIIILDSAPEKIELAKKNDLIAYPLDYRQDHDLIEIGVGSSLKTLLCFLEHDSENIFLTLSARSLDKKLNIISLVNHSESAEKLFSAGANQIIDPYEICSNKVYQLLNKPHLSWLLDHVIFGRTDLNIAEVTIPKNSTLDKTSTKNLSIHEKYNLFLIGLVDKELGEKLYFSLAEQDHMLDVGDILVILGSRQDIKYFKQKIGIID
jgi:voltage-gated potassium channel